MDDILWKQIWKLHLSVKKIRGKNEFEMYKNYINDLPFERIAFYFDCFFELGGLKQKNDLKATQLRIQGNYAYEFRDYQESLRLYTKSLRYANCNSKEYAVALANRSAVLFALEDYKSSIDNINLCWETNYPNDLKPKLYIRKAKCFRKLGEVADMRTTLIDLLNYLESSKALLKSTTEKYEKMVKDLITASVEKKSDPEDNFDIIPTLKVNPKFLNASSSVMLKYNKRRGCHVVAKEEIVRGDILFVEKAYAFAPISRSHLPKQYCPLYCQYCLLKMSCSVPCKHCVKHLYCNEKCRESAWKEFHQWECIGVQGGFLKNNIGYLALRAILEAVSTGISTDVIHFEDGVNSYGNKDNNYPYVYNLPSNIHKMKSSVLMKYVATAALIVNYLRMKTKFFEWMKQLPEYANKSYKELMNKLGGLIIRHSIQFQRCEVPVVGFDNASIPQSIPIATAVCPSIVMMNHSCNPNTAFYFVGDTVIVKATRNIKINEDVCYSMSGSPLMALDKAVRQELLQKLYYLTCSCQICSDPRMDTHNTYLCIKCKGPAPLSNSNHPFALKECVCLDCNYKFTLPTDVAIRERLAFALYTRFCELKDINDANRCLLISKATFRPNHTIFEALYRELLDCYTDRDNAECSTIIGKMLLHHIENKYDEFATESGMMCYIICMKLVQILQRTAVCMNTQHLGETLKDLTNFVERARMVFTLQYPQFGARLQKVDKSIFEFRILHTLQIANEKVHNLF